MRGIDLEVAAGEVFGFLGPNGAGKTTTIEILEGYRSAHRAATCRCSASIPRAPTRAWRDRIGLVLQACELDPLLTVRETLSLFAGFYSTPRPVDEIVELVGLARQARRARRAGSRAASGAGPTWASR